MPTVAATLPGFSEELIDGLFAPAKTPEAIIKRLNHAVLLVLNRPDVKEKFFNIGVEVVGSTAEQLRATLKSEMTKWGKLIKDVGIRDE